MIQRIILFLVAVCLPFAAGAEEAIGKVVFVKGEANVSRLSDPKPKPLVFNEDIFQMDTLQTGKGELKILFEDQTLLSLKEKTKVLITEHVYQPGRGVRKSIYDVIKGRVRAIVEHVTKLANDDVRFETPTSVAGIRGTDLGIGVIGGVSDFLCFDCSDAQLVAFPKENPSATVEIGTGNHSRIDDARGTPTPPEAFSPETEQQFSAAPESLGDIVEQPGGETFQPQSEDSPSGLPAPSEEPTVGAEGVEEKGVTEQPTLESPIIPGGEDETPHEATQGGDSGGGTTTGPVQIPIVPPEEG